MGSARPVRPSSVLQGSLPVLRLQRSHRSARAGGDPYLSALRTEAERVGAALGPERTVVELHLGGGTPTYYPHGDLVDLVRALRRSFSFAADAELSLEADPRVTRAAHLDALAAEGFGRISLGVQDLDPQVQKAVRREQPFAQIAALVTHARTAGFRSLNVDLVYGLPHQTANGFAETVDRVLELRPDRVACYSFAYVPWHAPHQRRLDAAALPRGRDKIELLLVARERFLDAGYRAIGMDHFALPDDPLARALDAGTVGRNFMGYTPRRAPDLIGLGVSAIGTVGDLYAQNTKKLSRYHAALERGELPVARGLWLDANDRLRRFVIESWMCRLEVDWREVGRRFGVDAHKAFAAETPALRDLEREGLIVRERDRLRATALGALFPRNVAMAFDARLCRHAAAAPAAAAPAAEGDAPRFSRTV